MCRANVGLGVWLIEIFLAVFGQVKVPRVPLTGLKLSQNLIDNLLFDAHKLVVHQPVSTSRPSAIASCDDGHLRAVLKLDVRILWTQGFILNLISKIDRT